MNSAVVVSGQSEIQYNRNASSVEINRVYVLAGESRPCTGLELSSQALADYAEVLLLKEYEVLERKHLSSILDEQKLGMTGLVFEDQAVEAGCLQGSEGVIFCEVGCLAGRELLKLKLVDCKESVQQWSIIGLEVKPSDLLDALLDSIESGELSVKSNATPEPVSRAEHKPARSNVTLNRNEDEKDKTAANESAFRCGQPFVYQGHAYATTRIGNQCWFAENLKSKNYRNGESILSNLTHEEWEEARSGAVSVYGDLSYGCRSWSPDGNACDEEWSLDNYGRLYNWYAVNDSRELCPFGWHVPSNQDWTELEEALEQALAQSPMGRFSSPARQIKSLTGWGEFLGGNNRSGFTGKPGGTRNPTYMGSGLEGVWWSSSKKDTEGRVRVLNAVSEEIQRSTRKFSDGCSVRCVSGKE